MAETGAALEALVGRVRLLALDVDGVLTDNALWIGVAAGEPVELKRFDVSDGLGLGLMRMAGIPVVIVSGRRSDATVLRAAELRIEDVLQVKGSRKVEALEPVLERHGVEWGEVAFLGDDLADLAVLGRVALPMAVANAVPEVKALAHYVTQARGGHGAVREAVELLLKGQGRWGGILERYVAGETASVR
jgi:3-deoxy-D-manno-octulosonate 8-phosphate phosphatase (KDO 8-P phosphatase)